MRTHIPLVLCALCSVPALSAAEPEGSADVEKGFVPLFNGKDLDGWSGDEMLWSVHDGVIVGDSKGIKRNEFLVTDDRYDDFELRLEFRLVDGRGNSGVQFRSELEKDSPQVVGYQADLGQKYWGCLYDEHRRRKVLAAAPASLDDVLDKDGWNEYRIRAEGPRVRLAINDHETVDFSEPDPEIARTGIIALQIHSGPAMRVEFRNIRLKRLDDR